MDQIELNENLSVLISCYKFEHVVSVHARIIFLDYSEMADHEMFFNPFSRWYVLSAAAFMFLK